MNQRYVPLRRVRGPRWLARAIIRWKMHGPARKVFPPADEIPLWPDAQVQIVCVQQEDGRDRIIAAVRTDEEAMEFEREHIAANRAGRLCWIEMPLQDLDGYPEQWPDINVVYIVSEGGLGDDPTDPEADATMRGIFTSLEAAEQYLREDDLERPDFCTRPTICPMPVGRQTAAG